MIRISEAAFQQQVIAYAKLRRWRVAHFRPAQTKDGWRTPVSGDGKGFPDTILVRGTRIVVAELKAERGRLSKEQWAWIDAFTVTPAETFVWFPEDWPEIERVLK